MTNPSVRVEGARELRRALSRAEGDLADFKAANRRAADIVADAGRSDAPHRTGKLERSVRASATRTQAVVRAGSAAVPYAGVIHWGWPARHIDAQPWLADDAVQTQPTWLRVYESALADIVDTIERNAHP